MGYKFDWGVLLVYRHLLWQGLVLTVQLSALGMVLSLALGVEFINVIKNSSIAMTISVTELPFQPQQIESLTFRGFEAATAITLLYVLLALTIVLLMAAIERVVRLDLRVG